LPEESAFFLSFVKKQIPRFTRDDNKIPFSAATSACLLLTSSAELQIVLNDSRFKTRQAALRRTQGKSLPYRSPKNLRTIPHLKSWVKAIQSLGPMLCQNGIKAERAWQRYPVQNSEVHPATI